jgi:hypothetical protein
MKSNKSLNFLRRKNIQRRNNNYIPRNPTLGVVVRRICVSRDTIGIANGSPDLYFTSIAQPYKDLSNLLTTSQDFNNLLTDYTICKIHSVKISVRRVIGEIAFNALGISMYPVYVAFFPSKTALLADATNNENALLCPGLTLNAVTKTYPIVDLTSTVTIASVRYFLNPAEWFDTSAASAIPGSFVVGWNNTTNASAGGNLYSMEVFMDISFAGPY